MNLGVVYHAYLINNWKDIVHRQLTRLKDSGLMHQAKKVIVTANLARTSEQSLYEVLQPFSSHIELRTYQENLFEYPGCQAIYDMADSCLYDGLLYFHTKGVFNRYSSFQTLEYDDQIIHGVRSWTHLMEYFLIDQWSQTIQQLEHADQCGWFFDWPKGETGNFWWATAKHIQRIGPPEKSKLDRCTYERWPIHTNQHKRYNVFPFLKCNSYMSHFDSALYQNFHNKKIIIHQALYGNFSPNDCSDTIIARNVTRHIQQFLSDQHMTIDIHVGNRTIEQDPYYGRKKKLRLHCSFENEFNSFVLVGDENTRFYFSTFKEII